MAGRTARTPAGSSPGSAMVWLRSYFSLGLSFSAYKRGQVGFDGSLKFLPVQRVILVFWGLLGTEHIS